MESYGLWQIDLFRLFMQYEIYSVEDFNAMEESQFEDFLLKAKYNGLIADKPKILKALYYNTELPSSDDKKPQKKPPSKQIVKDPKEIENEARDKLEPWMNKYNFWQVDLFRLFMKYEIYSPEEFHNLEESRYKDLFREAKQNGLVGQKPLIMNALYYNTALPSNDPTSNDEKEDVIKPQKPKKQEPSPEEQNNAIRDKLEPWMRQNGFWQIDLLHLLIENGMTKPSDLNKMNKNTMETILREAKSKGLMGKAPSNFEEAWKQANNK